MYSMYIYVYIVLYLFASYFSVYQQFVLFTAKYFIM